MAALRKLDTAKDSGHEKPFLRRYCRRKLELVALVSQVGLLRVRFLAAKARVGKSGHPTAFRVHIAFTSEWAVIRAEPRRALMIGYK